MLASAEDDVDRQAAAEFARAKAMDTHEFQQDDTENPIGDGHEECISHVEEEFQALDEQVSGPSFFSLFLLKSPLRFSYFQSNVMRCVSSKRIALNFLSLQLGPTPT